MEQENKLIVFQDKEIRSVWHNEEWWFPVVDVIEVLTDSSRPRKYWSDLKKVGELVRAKGTATKVFGVMKVNDPL